MYCLSVSRSTGQWIEWVNIPHTLITWPSLWSIGFLHCWRLLFWTQPDQTIDFEIDICCFFTRHTTFWSKSKDWSAGSCNNVTWVEGWYVFLQTVASLWTSTLQIWLSDWYYKAGFIFISYFQVLVLNMNLICCWTTNNKPSIHQ